MSLLEQMTQHLGGMHTLARAVPRGDVLGQIALTIQAKGFVTRTWRENFQAVNIVNLGTLPLVATTAGELTQAPTQGSGVATIPPGTDRTVTLRGTQLTVYGTPGQTFEVTAFNRPREPFSAVASNGPGAGVLLAAGQSATETAQLTGLGAERLVLVLDVAAITGSVTLTVAGITPSGYPYPLLNGLAIAAPGVTPYRIGPALTPSLNAVANDVVPSVVAVTATVAGSATYGVDFVVGP